MFSPTDHLVHALAEVQPSLLRYSSYAQGLSREAASTRWMNALGKPPDLQAIADQRAQEDLQRRTEINNQALEKLHAELAPLLTPQPQPSLPLQIVPAPSP